MTERGFADVAVDSAHAFRAIMQAMARPGRVMALGNDLAAPEPLISSAAAVALTLPAAALAVALTVVPLAPGDHAAEHALLIFAAVTGAAVTWGWLQRRPGLGGALIGAAFLAPAAIGYVAIINGLGGFLAPALPVSTLSVTAVWFITAAAALALGALAVTRWAPGAEGLRRSIYASALTAGHVSSRQSSPVMTGVRS